MACVGVVARILRRAVSCIYCKPGYFPVLFLTISSIESAVSLCLVLRSDFSTDRLVVWMSVYAGIKTYPSPKVAPTNRLVNYLSLSVEKNEIWSLNQSTRCHLYEEGWLHWISNILYFLPAAGRHLLIPRANFLETLRLCLPYPHPRHNQSSF